MAEINLQLLGPLAKLAGTWEGALGDDIAPSDDRGVENNKFRERITFTPIGSVDNHEQKLHGLRYQKVAWRLSEDNPFHEETGYWLWDQDANQVMRAFIVPRGISVIAGGTVDSQATSFALRADAGSPVYGICSNPFLDREFKTIRFEVMIEIKGNDQFSYSENTVMQIAGQKELFNHRDKNTLKKVSEV
jgi:hypothetical protein